MPHNTENEYYKVKLLVTNLLKNEDASTKTDVNLRAPYGIVIQKQNTNSGQPEIWVANTNSGFVTHYSLQGCPLLQTNLVVPSADPTNQPVGSPTGIVYNSTSGFVITKGNLSGKSILLVSTSDGLIAGWNPAVDPVNFIIAHNANLLGLPNKPSFKGLAIYNNYIYATDFTNNRVVTLNNTFVVQNNYPFIGPGFEQLQDPNIGLNCNGITVINTSIFVTYGLREAAIDYYWPLLGPGFGVIDEFKTDGSLIRRVVNSASARNESLNRPYGLTWINNSFAENGETSILSGQNGSGEFHVYDISSGFLSQILKLKNGDVIDIDRLHGMESILYKGQDYVYFVAGSRSYNKGVLGVIKRHQCPKPECPKPECPKPDCHKHNCHKCGEKKCKCDK